MRGHVRKRRTWEFIVNIGPHPVTGRRRQKSKSGFATKKEAESALHEFIRYIEGGGDPSPERIGLSEYLNRWIEFQRTRGIRSRTLDSYEGYIRREIVPVIGGLELAKIRPGHVRAVLALMQRRGAAAATIAQVRSILGSGLRQAVADGLIRANPVAAVRHPRVAGNSTGRHLRSSGPCWRSHGARGGRCRSCSPWSPGPAAPRSSASPGRTLISRREPVSIRRGVQPVRHAEGRTAEFTPLKTKRSRRVVQLPPFALERIRQHKREQLKRRTAFGTIWRDPLDELGRPVALVCDRGDGFFNYPRLVHHRVQAAGFRSRPASRHPIA